MIKQSAYLFILLCIFISCSTNKTGPFVEKKSVNSSIQGLVKAFDRATTGVRGKSANGRELVSRYQKPGTNSFDNAAGDKIRGYSRLRILGDRRPYDLQVQYVIEERSPSGNYAVKSYDDVVAKQVLQKVLEFLVNRPDREDFIDEFKAF